MNDLPSLLRNDGGNKQNWIKIKLIGTQCNRTAIGARVHVSAAAQIGGVIEPVGALPVIVEDDVLVGGNTGIYEGAIVKSRAVVAAGTVLTGSTPVYDLVRGEIIKPSADRPLVIPEGAVVVPGARAVTSGKGVDWKLSLATPVIVKYRDSRTDGVMEDVFARVPRARIYETTGIQFLTFNTLFQLVAAARHTPRLLEAAIQLGAHH